MASQNQPLVLIILDGWGYRQRDQANGIEQAQKPFFDRLWRDYPHTLIDSSGPAVGLPKGIMGNSEVGHMNLGAGRIVYSGLAQIYHAIETGEFFTNPAFGQAVSHVKKNEGTLHLLGLLSDGAVHSHQDHLYALLTLAKKNNLARVAVHAILDGRDTSPQSGIDYLKGLKARLGETGVGRLASLSGRYYAMDRDRHWRRTEKAFWAVCGRSTTVTRDPLAYLTESYGMGVGDEFVVPASVTDETGTVSSVKGSDAMIFFNFRADRARQISHAFASKEFDGFDRRDQQLPGVFVCAAPYDKALNVPVAFEPEYPKRTLPEILADNGVKQLRIAETEKYAHVTFFFNGGRDVVYEGEERRLIPSPREVPTYDKKPEMSAFWIKEALMAELGAKKFGVVIANFANADMVGHTAIPEAIVKAVETVDQCLAEIVPKVLAQGGTVIITADHGNAEEMVDKYGLPMTAHTTNLVPFILISDRYKNNRLRSGGRLCDVAPTMLKILGIEPPAEMTGVSLLGDG